MPTCCASASAVNERKSQERTHDRGHDLLHDRSPPSSSPGRTCADDIGASQNAGPAARAAGARTPRGARINHFGMSEAFGSAAPSRHLTPHVTTHVKCVGGSRCSPTGSPCFPEFSHSPTPTGERDALRETAVAAPAAFGRRWKVRNRPQEKHDYPQIDARDIYRAVDYYL